MATILILDDDTRFRRVAACVLQARGHKIVEAPNGRSAMSIAEGDKPDLAIVDYRLPDIDGLQWIAWLRDRGILIPVIFLSGFHCDEKMLNRLRNVLNVSLVLQKPIEPATFADQVEDVLHETEIRFTAWLGGSTAIASNPEDSRNLSGLSSKDWLPADDEQSPDQDIIAIVDEDLDFDALINEYAAELPKVLSEIGDLVELAVIDPEQFGLIDGIIDRFHKLRGTAGTYGQPEVGDIAGNVEDLLRRVQNDELSLSPQIWDEIKSALLQAQATAESFVPTAGSVSADELTSSSIPSCEHQPQPARLLVDENGNCAIVDQATAVSLPQLQTESNSETTDNQSNATEVDRPMMLLFDTCESTRQQLITVAGSRAITAVAITCLADAMDALSSRDIAFAVLNANAKDAPEAVAIIKGLNESKRGGGIPTIFSTPSFSLHEHAVAAQAGATLCIDKPLAAANFDRVVQELFKEVNSDCPRVICLGQDDSSLATMVSSLTKDGVNAVSLTDASEVLKLISNFRPHLLLLLDASNPSMSGLDVCRAVKDSENFRDIAVVFYVGTVTSKFRLAAANAGADDFIQQGSEWPEVVGRILRHAENAKSRMARLGSDALTGLLLPSPLLHRLETLVGECQQEQQPFTVCKMVIGDLHSIDVAAVYESVNEVLKVIGTIMTVKLRDQAVCGNSAGEFILAFPGQSKESVLSEIKQLILLVESVRLLDQFGATIKFSLNYQIGSYPADGLCLSELLAGTRVSNSLVNA